jgi:hypothetical protein
MAQALHEKVILYRIKNWDGLYENSRSRSVAELSWVAIPNRHDGENYSAIITHKDGAIIFAAWVLIIQVASKCQPRGTLLKDNGSAHTPESLSLKTRAPAEWFVLALKHIASNTDWLEYQELTNGCQVGDSWVSGCHQDGELLLTGMEWNGKEGGKGTAASPPRPRFEKPELVLVTAYCVKLGLPEGEGQAFLDFYESNGWRVGKNPMKDWPAAVRNWKRRFNERHSSAHQHRDPGDTIDRPAV